ncbi:MAG: hypothetical protein HY885_03675 [Deltaproteobacteria bacterium]|nr:hypothetical protein [Deltaproteobacteria bacterium]
MNPEILPADISNRIAALYHEMQDAYDALAHNLAFSCTGCPDNCCDSYFQHHTYTEWAYLWEGLSALPREKKEYFIARATDYERESETMLAREQRPQIMCPINEGGLCALYPHRMMICRLHGVPAAMTRPDSKHLEFPGCFRCQELVAGRKTIARLDRTEMYQELVRIEMDWLGPKRRILPRVRMTLAEMIVKGPPGLNYRG